MSATSSRREKKEKNKQTQHFKPRCPSSPPLHTRHTQRILPPLASLSASSDSRSFDEELAVSGKKKKSQGAVPLVFQLVNGKTTTKAVLKGKQPEAQRVRVCVQSRGSVCRWSNVNVLGRVF